MHEKTLEMDREMDEETLQQIYAWIDEIPLTRPKRNITRDFSDGVLIAEIIKHFLPGIIDLHNYTAANSTSLKMDNWNLLSRKVFNRLQYAIEEDNVKGVVMCKPGYIEHILFHLRESIDAYLARKKDAEMIERKQMEDVTRLTKNTRQTSDAYESSQLMYKNSSSDPYAAHYYQPAPPLQHNYQSPGDNENIKETNAKIKPTDKRETKSVIISSETGFIKADEDRIRDGSTVADHPKVDKDTKKVNKTDVESTQKESKSLYSAESQLKSDEYELKNMPKKTTKKQNLVYDIQPNPPGVNLSPKHKNGAASIPRNQQAQKTSKLKGKQNGKVSSPLNNEVRTLKMAIEEKEQALLASQETVQILQVKIRRLEHLLHLKDMRIAELKEYQPNQANQQAPLQQYPASINYQHAPVPPGSDVPPLDSNYPLPHPRQQYSFQNGHSLFATHPPPLPQISKLPDNRHQR